jgi:hypothetical protein
MKKNEFVSEFPEIPMADLNHVGGGAGQVDTRYLPPVTTIPVVNPGNPGPNNIEPVLGG